MLLIDPTEASSTSRNPPDFLVPAKVCANFEAITGADFMISPLEAPEIKDLDTKVGQVFLRKHLEAGAQLFQRKTVADITNLITDGAQIMAKMLTWTTSPWLLTVGNFSADAEQKLLCDAQRAGGVAGWSYWSYEGALYAWQIRGGYVVNLASENLLADWYTHTLERLQHPEPVTIITPRKPSQIISVTSLFDAENPGAYERACAIAALATIDGVGTQKAIEIVDYVGGKLKDALVFLSDPAHLALKNRPKGVGSKIFANTSRWLGLENTDHDYETILVATVDK